MNDEMEPKLAAPGAGLPKAELAVAQVLFGWRQRRGNRESFARKFESERERIRTLVKGCATERAGRRVLIERLRGLEDSSRYWSVWMTLEHLRIVNTGIARTITQLSRGTAPTGKASTAAVKPGADVGPEVVEAYEKSCDAVLKAAVEAGDLKTAARYEHPWFGPLDAHGWFALAGGHLEIHRTQIERILEAISKTPRVTASATDKSLTGSAG